MKTTLLLALAVILTFSLATAQTTKIVVGPLDGDNAGPIMADTNETIDVDIWIRTAPGVKVVGMHIPVATKDEYIQADSRNGGDFFFPIPLWDAAYFLTPAPDFETAGYTNQSFLAIKDFDPGEEPDPLRAISTNGNWIRILTYEMTTADSGYGLPMSDAFLMGRHRDNGYAVLVDFPTREMAPSEYEFDLATLEITMTTGVEDEIVTPNSYALAQNYPNPFNASTTINYSLPQEGNVTIDIFDIMGRKIETLVSGRQPAGEHSVVWNADYVSSGVYLYRINAGSYSETRRCNLIK